MHFTVLVIADNYEQALEPFGVPACDGCVEFPECDDCEADYRTEYDWYELGGRVMGALVLSQPSERAVVGESFAGGVEKPKDNLHVSGAPVGLIDWEATREALHESPCDPLTHALLTLDGQWIDSDDNTLYTLWWDMVLSLPPDQMVWLVDYHI